MGVLSLLCIVPILEGDLLLCKKAGYVILGEQTSNQHYSMVSPTVFASRLRALISVLDGLETESQINPFILQISFSLCFIEQKKQQKTKIKQQYKFKLQ